MTNVPPATRLAAGHRGLEPPALERGDDRGVEAPVDAAGHLDRRDLSVGADGDAGLELALDAVRLRLRVERVVDAAVLTIASGLVGSSAQGASATAARPLRACLRVRASEMAEATLTGAARRLGAALEADARADVEPGVRHGQVRGHRRRRRVRHRRGADGLRRHRLDLGHRGVDDGLGRRGRLGRACAFFFSSCTATEIARRRSSLFWATATRPTARPTWSPTEMMTVGNRKDYSPLC